MIEFEKENLAHIIPSVRITVLGIGGAGCNTVNALLPSYYENVSYIAINTDVKSLEVSRAPHKVQIGVKSAKGLGAGANPEMGRRAAEEDLPEIMALVADSDIVFLTGGLGGGTGSGALPIVANALKERDILSIAVVTKPFSFEGKRRKEIAELAEEKLRNAVDTLITIPNEKLLQVTGNQQLSLVAAFEMVNGIVSQFVKSVADIISKPGYINVDFADLKAIMKGMGLAVMGTAQAEGAGRAAAAAQAAIQSPLLDSVSIKGARSVLLNVTGSSNLTLAEVSEAASLITQETHEDANIILGSVIDDTMGDVVSVTVIATGFETAAEKAARESVPLVLGAEKIVRESGMTLREAVQQMPLEQEAAPTVTYTKQPHPLRELLLEREEQLSPAAQKDLEVPTLLRKMVQEKQLQQK